MPPECRPARSAPCRTPSRPRPRRAARRGTPALTPPPGRPRPWARPPQGGAPPGGGGGAPPPAPPPPAGPLELGPSPIGGAPRRDATPPPLLGQHTREILAELGTSTEEIDSLAARGIVGAR